MYPLEQTLKPLDRTKEQYKLLLVQWLSNPVTLTQIKSLRDLKTELLNRVLALSKDLSQSEETLRLVRKAESIDQCIKLLEEI